MSWLLAASLLWAFSFGLIKRFLPDLDPWWVAAVRLAIASAALLPWAARRPPAPRHRGPALGLGALQFGAMYTLYIASFQYLAAWQVALWTVLTPILVVLLARLLEGGAVVRPAVGAVLAVAGALLAQGRWPVGDTLTGVLLVQGSNLCFAAGQVGYRRLARRAGAVPAPGAAAHHAAGLPVGGPAPPLDLGREAGLLGWMYLGGAALAAVGLVVAGDAGPAAVSGPVAATLLYLGLVPTAAGFWLWNRGAARTSAGRLAAANNLKVPLAVLVAWLVFGESAPYLRALLGLAVVVAALALAGGEGAGPQRVRERAEAPDRVRSGASLCSGVVVSGRGGESTPWTALPVHRSSSMRAFSRRLRGWTDTLTQRAGRNHDKNG